jgi:hypothetical protein
LPFAPPSRPALRGRAGPAAACGRSSILQVERPDTRRTSTRRTAAKRIRCASRAGPAVRRGRARARVRARQRRARRDQLSRLLYGGRVSLLAGLVAAALALGLGFVLGTLAGFYGRAMDVLVMRGAELFLACRGSTCCSRVRAFLPLHVPPARAFLLLVLVIGLVDWARPARLVAGSCCSARERGLRARGRARSGRATCT